MRTATDGSGFVIDLIRTSVSTAMGVPRAMSAMPASPAYARRPCLMIETLAPASFPPLTSAPSRFGDGRKRARRNRRDLQGPTADAAHAAAGSIALAFGIVRTVTRLINAATAM